MNNNSITIEFEKPNSLRNKSGSLKLIAFRNTSKSFKYRDAIKANIFHSDSLNQFRNNGTAKFGLGLNIEQDINETFVVFF